MGDRDSIPGRGRDFFSSPPRPEWLWGPPSFLSNGYRPGREIAHLPPSRADVKNAWNYTSIPPYILMAWCLIKQRIHLHCAVLWHR